LKTVCGPKIESTGRNDAFDRLDSVVFGMMVEANPARMTKYSCDDLSESLHLRSTQRALLKGCRGNFNEITTLMYYLDKRGVHMRDVIVDIKCVNRRLALEFCLARAKAFQLVMA
jgi:hypothetical protein